MRLLVQKTLQLNGEINIPGSKSESIRALMIATLAQGISVIHNFLEAQDTADALQVCQSLGVKITELRSACHQRCIKIVSRGVPLLLRNTVIQSGNSGITANFILPMLGLTKVPEEPRIFDCGEQMKKRPMQSLIQALLALGLTIEYIQQQNHLPLRVTGMLTGGETEVSGVTSQYLSGLLLSSPCARNPTKIRVKNLQEIPYVKMTLKWLDRQNIRYMHYHKRGEDFFCINGQQHYRPFDSVIPGDFSSASCFLAASALIPGTVIVKGLHMNELQGDKKLIDILQKMGADIVVKKDKIIIRGGKPLRGIMIDGKNIPDLLPALAVIGTNAQGKTHLYNVSHARLKETDRIHSMTENLRKMGAQIEEKKDGMIVYNSELYSAHVFGYHDHRTIMALAVAGMLTKKSGGTTCIDTVESIQKTFPTYISLMQQLGGNMDYTKN